MSDIAPFLKAGIPRTGDYKHLLETSFFRAMETYSNAFLQKNVFLQDHYKWVKDPLHQWSRQWEYPYVYRSVKKYQDTRHNPHSSVKVLDAGSGATFFPYYLESTIEGLDITCCDSDSTLAPLFDRVNLSTNIGSGVKFVKADMHALPFGDKSMDVVYCISVLEHTRSYSHILDEFHRILQPGGCLVLTFDIGLDGVSEIALESARALLGETKRKFTCMRDNPDIETGMTDVLTSRYVIQLDGRLSPWRFPRLILVMAALRAKRIPTSLRKNLTVYCNTFVKPATQI